MVFQKRGRWCYTNLEGKLHKCSSHEEALELEAAELGTEELEFDLEEEDFEL